MIDVKRLIVRVVACGTWLAGAAGTATAATFSYPGAAPCNTTLQACIDAAASGDIVQIVTNTPIAESPDIEKSLTLRAGLGFKPAVSSVLAISNGSAADTITIQGLISGPMTLIQGSSGPLKVNVLDNVISAGSYNNGIEIRTGFPTPPRGNVTFRVTGNQITVPEMAGSPPAS